MKWHVAGGPDTEGNGIALCVLHHRLLDRGALGISPDLQVQVSQHVYGGEQVSRHISQLSGRALREPVAGARHVNPEYVAWHAKEVFRSPARA